MRLLLKRVEVDHPELSPAPQPPSPPKSATNAAWGSQRQNGSHSKVQSYWDARASRSFDSEDGEVAFRPLEHSPATPELVAVVVPAGAPLGARIACDESGELTVARVAGVPGVRDGACVVGVNADRDRVSYERVEAALSTAARPLLVLLASIPPDEAPPKRKTVHLPEGPLGLRLVDARGPDGTPVARVARVAPGGRAWKGGVHVGDAVTVVDGDNVAGYAHALALLADRRPCEATFAPCGEGAVERRVAAVARAQDLRRRRVVGVRQRVYDPPEGPPRRVGRFGWNGARPLHCLALAESAIWYCCWGACFRDLAIARETPNMPRREAPQQGHRVSTHIDQTRLREGRHAG